MKTRRNKNLAEEIPSLEDLEKRFSFIEDDTKRANVAIAFQYIIFLIVLNDKEQPTGAIFATINKNMIVYTALIIECCIHYCLNKYIAEGKVSEVVKTDKELIEIQKLHQITENTNRSISIVEKRLTEEKLKDTTNFVIINRVALKAGILTKNLFLEVDEIRKKRNKIHLYGLLDIDTSYAKEDVQEVFDIAKRVVERIERKLSEL